MGEEARPRYRELLARLQKPLDTSVIAAALATIPLTIIQRGPGDPLWVNALDWLVWGVFLVEYSFMIRVVKDPWPYTRRNWLSVAVIVLSFPMLPDVLALVRVARLSRLVRLFRLVRVVAVAARGLTAVEKCLGREGLVYVASLTFVLTLAGGAFMAALEPDTVEHGLVGGLWWAFVTVTTVGYGDITPVTAAGRLLAVFLMLTGLGMISTLAASISAYFISSDEQPDFTEFKQRLDRIEKLLETMAANGSRQRGNGSRPPAETG